MAWDMEFQLRCLIVFLVMYVPCEALLCFNGSFSSDVYGDDPLRRWEFLHTRRDRIRSRCRFSILCEVPLWCYNCSATQTAWSGCGEEFTRTAPGFTLNRLKSEVQCSGENASCFVRSLSTRSRHSWVVQRGCYYPGKDDSVSLALVKSRRRMACKNERLPDAEYTVCLCRTDLCNAASQRQPQHYIILLGIFIAIQMRQNNFVL